MEKRIVIAYANKTTDYVWTLAAVANTIESAKSTCLNWAGSSMKNSALAIIRDSANGVHFSEKRPAYIYNRHVLTEIATLTKLAGLINSRDSSSFTN